MDHLLELVWPVLCCSPLPQSWGARSHPPDSPPHLSTTVPLIAHLYAVYPTGNEQFHKRQADTLT